MAACALPLTGNALEVAPWFGNIWECNFTGNYTYSRYSRVQHGDPDLKSPSNDQRFGFSLEMPLAPTWDLELEIEFVDTPRQKWGMRSYAGQFRYLWLDDVSGDPISLTTGFNVRGVSSHSLSDVSSPYHSNVNFELNTAAGKEWSKRAFWRMRTFAFAGVGIANHGSLWVRALAAFEGNYVDKHRYQLFANSYWGFGPDRAVNVNHFHGYAKIHHQSIDIGAGYSYLFDFWGSLTIDYAFRVYARSFPEYVNFFALTYKLPFSIF
jgi:hypothetical protein